MMGHFTKYEALGNDYIVIDPTRTELPITTETVVLLCDRHRGVGGDGVLYGPFFEGDAVRLRIFNSDGSECEKSGNGLRMFARYLREHGHVTTDRFVLRTLAGDATAQVVDLDAGVFTIAMGTFTFDSERIPATGPPRRLLGERLELDGETLRINCVSVGNPHCVILGDKVSREQALQLGPVVSRHRLFPSGINVQFAAIRDRSNVDAEVWERGSGYTLASGSSACAIACVAHALELTEPTVTVHMPGGRLSITITPSREVFLTGEACAVAEGTLAPGLLKRLAALAGSRERR
jgi:diaminopimelate epimerase